MMMNLDVLFLTGFVVMTALGLVFVWRLQLAPKSSVVADLIEVRSNAGATQLHGALKTLTLCACRWAGCRKTWPRKYRKMQKPVKKKVRKRPANKKNK